MGKRGEQGTFLPSPGCEGPGVEALHRGRALGISCCSGTAEGRPRARSPCPGRDGFLLPADPAHQGGTEGCGGNGGQRNRGLTLRVEGRT